MGHEPHLLEESFARVEHVADKVALYFYARLFLEDPRLRDLFPAMMDVQRSRLLTALVRVVQGFDSPVLLDRYLHELGHDHRKFDVRPEHYAAVGRALIAALREYSGAAWTPEVEHAWVTAYGAIADRMLAGAAAGEGTPAWWNATVVGHERPSRDLALITVQPDPAYRHRPGQYLTLRTPRRPKLWRRYSIANAPRPDGRLELQVRAVPGGWVSGALVSHTGIGDRLRLGPPQGTLHIDRQSDRDLVFVAGGTGLAPCRAMVEDLAQWNSDREVHVFYGARQIDDLHGLSVLCRLADQHPWLTVVSAVSHDPDYVGRRGCIPDIAADHRPWPNHTVFASGPPAMIRSTVERFRQLDVPAEEIRFDPFDDP